MLKPKTPTHQPRSTAMLRDCSCSIPRPSLNPRKRHTCVVCGLQVNPDWHSGSRLPAIWNRLFAGYVAGPPDAAARARSQCIERDHWGQERFGYTFLGRDNLKEALQEVADALNYLAEDIIKDEREGDEESADATYCVMMQALDFYEGICGLARAKERP